MASGGGNSSSLRTRLMSTRTCVICCHESDFFCMGICSHPVCFECGTRIRVICQSKECPICRNESEEVYMVSDPSLDYSSASHSQKLLKDPRGEKYGIKFDSKAALDAFLDMLAHVCTICNLEPEFPTFDALQLHMRREHQLFYCDLCLTLNLFSWERKCYNRKELAEHRRVGDADDRSHRGHPLCSFCDTRFLDNDHLYRHLRRDHFFCHFCDADGVNHFYDTYDELKDHFRDSHFLCEEGNCRYEQFTPAFRSEIDLKGHKTALHSKEMQKAHRRQERTINLEFNYDRPGEQRGIGAEGSQFRRNKTRTTDTPFREGGGGRRGVRQWEGRGTPPTDAENTEPQDEIIPIESGAAKISTVIRVPAARLSPQDTQAAYAQLETREENFQVESEDFPTLGTGSGFSSDGFRNFAGWNRLPAYQHGKGGSLGERDFPTLSRDGDGEGAMESSQSSSSSKGAKKGAGMILIDDDDAFPSISSTSRPLKQPTEKRRMEKESDKENGAWSSVPERKSKSPSLFETLTSGAWAGSNRPKTLGQAALTLSNDAEFPSLGGQGKLKGQREAKPVSIARSQAESVWHKPGSTEKAEKKTGGGGKQKAAEKEVHKEKKAVESLVTLPAAKTKARRVAQQKQRSSTETPQTDSVSLALASGLGPPGLELSSAVGPPPGLTSVPADHVVGEQHLHEHFHGSYVRPRGFAERNRKLFDKISSSLQQGLQMDDFKMISGMFRRGEIGAKQYNADVKNLLGGRVFEEIFPELLCLLPDIKRQRALLEIHERELKLKEGANRWKKKGPWNTGNLTDDLLGECRVCRHCAQVLREADFLEHVGGHDLDQDYPALS